MSRGELSTTSGWAIIAARNPFRCRMMAKASSGLTYGEVKYGRRRPDREALGRKLSRTSQRRRHRGVEVPQAARRKLLASFALIRRVMATFGANLSRRPQSPGRSAGIMLGGVTVFWVGMLGAVVDYPASFDWRFVTVSSLLYRDRNPAGHAWGLLGVGVCGLLGAWWSTRHALRLAAAGDSSSASRSAFWTLTAGFSTMSLVAVLTEQEVTILKVHEVLALTSFLCLCAGIVRLCFATLTEMFPLRTQASALRLPVLILAGTPLFPVLLAGVTQLYLALYRPGTPWVTYAWRALGLPAYLSFAAWEWIACVVFSLFVLSIAFAVEIVPRYQPGRPH